MNGSLGPGAVFRRYRIERVIGAGAMGAVYQAVHLDLGKVVALKVLHPTVANEQMVARFLREGQAAARVRHPHVVDVTDIGEEEGTPFLVMEYLEGEDLAALLARRSRLPPSEACELLLPVFSAVAALHDNDVLHRDLKPQNIFLARNRQGRVEPKLVDFGISKVSGESGVGLTQTASLLGTPLYMSPEQVRDVKGIDARSDQYSLGVIFYECVVGKPPFEFSELYPLLTAIAQGAFLRPSEACPELPLALEQVLLRMMALERSNRFPNVHAAAAQLVPFASADARSSWERLLPAAYSSALAPTHHASTPAVSVPRSTEDSFAQQTDARPPLRRSPVPIALGAVALLGGAIAIGFWALGPTKVEQATASSEPPPAPPSAVAAPVAAPIPLAPQPASPPASASASATALSLPSAVRSTSATSPATASERTTKDPSAKPTTPAAPITAPRKPAPTATSVNRSPILD